jgi:hypothetical protein
MRHAAHFADITGQEGRKLGPSSPEQLVKVPAGQTDVGAGRTHDTMTERWWPGRFTTVHLRFAAPIAAPFGDNYFAW